MTAYGPWQEYATGSDVEDFQRGQQIGSGLVEAHEQVAQSRLQQQAMEQQIKQAAQRFQAQQQYRDYIQGGGDPNTGMKMFGPLMFGSSATGMAQLFKPPPSTTIVPPGTTGTFPGHAIVGHAAAPPTPSTGAAIPITDPNTGNVVGYSYGKSTHWSAPPKAAAQPKFDPVDQNMLNDISANERIIEAQLVRGDLPEADSIKARNTLADLKKQKQAIYAKYQSAAAQPPPAGESDKITHPAPPSIQPAPATSAMAPATAVNPQWQAPTPNSALPPVGTTASGNKFRLVTPQSPAVAPPTPAAGAAAPAPDRILHQRFPAPAPVPAPDQYADVGSSESAWRGVENTQDELDNYSSYAGITRKELQQRHDQWKKLAEWYDTPPAQRGPKPPKPPLLIMHPTF